MSETEGFGRVTHAFIYNDADGRVVGQYRVDSEGKFIPMEPDCVSNLNLHRRRPDSNTCYCGAETFTDEDED